MSGGSNAGNSMTTSVSAGGGYGGWVSTPTTATFLTSPTTEKLDDALAKAQGEMKNAVKSKTNPFFNSKYADLSDVWDACRPALSKHGLSVTQWPVISTDEQLHLVTRIGCDGEWMLAQASVPVTKQDPQGYGSALSYLRRYALSALLGIATEDDDGQQATDAGKTPKPKKAAKPKPATHTDSAPAPSALAERRKAIRELPTTLGIDGEVYKRVYKDVLGTTAFESTTDEQLTQFEAALRGTPEAVGKAFGSEEPPF